MTAEIDYAKFDAMFEKDQHEEAHKELMELYNNGNENNVEVLWRLARALYFMALSGSGKDKNLMYEGQKYAIRGHEIDAHNFECLRWASILTGSISDISGNKEKIQQGNLFKDLLDKALAINSDEFTLLHMSGRLCFSVASLSWIERKLATTLYGKPPEATMDEAIEKFSKAKELKPTWIENKLYLAKALAAKDSKANKACIIEELKTASEFDPENVADRNAKEEVQSLLKKYAK